MFYLVSNAELLADRLSILLMHVASLEDVSEALIYSINHDFETLREKISMNPSKAALVALQELESVFKTIKST